MTQCPFCGTVNEATVRNEYIDAMRTTVIGPVWTCTVCEQSWMNDEAEAILEQYDTQKA